MIKQKRVCAALVACAVLAACNGGSNNDSSGSGGGTTSLQGFMAFFESPGGDLAGFGMVVPASGTAAPLQISASGPPPKMWMANQISTSTAGAPTGVTHVGLVYLGGEGNHWFGVPLTPGTTPAPVQIASDSVATLCQGPVGTFGGSQASIDVNPVVVYRDLTVGVTAFMLYSTSGPDQACGTLDDLTQAVNLQGNATQSAITLPGVPVAAVYHANGKLSGLVLFALDPVLGSQGFGTLSFLSDTTNFTSPTTLATTVTYQSLALNDASNTLLHGKQVFLALITANTSVQSGIYRLNDQGALSLVSSEAFSALGPNITAQSAADATHLYYLNGTALKSVPLDGSASATVVGTYTGGPYVIKGLTDNNVVVTQGSSVLMLPKQGDVNSTTPIGVSSSFELRFVSAKYLFLDSPPGGTTPTQAAVVGENGLEVGSALSMAEWAGARYVPDGSGGVLPQFTLAGVIASVATTQTTDATNPSTVDFNNATFSEVSPADATATAFTAPAGASSTFSYVRGTFSYQSSVPVDDGVFTTAGSSANQVYEFDFLDHLIKPLTTDSLQKTAVN